VHAIGEHYSFGRDSLCAITGKGTGRIALGVIAILNRFGWFVEAMAL
jgi:hypothetical protein